MLPERALEDLICEYPYALIESLGIICRQAEFPHGKIDILGYDEWLLPPHRFCLYIIELKMGRADDKQAAQLARYYASIRPRLLHWSYQEGQGFQDAWLRNSEITPVLVARSFSRNALQMVHHLDGMCIAWSANKKLEVSFEEIEPPDSFYPDSWLADPIRHNWEDELGIVFRRYLRSEPTQDVLVEDR